jgi:hypothetical protein
MRGPRLKFAFKAQLDPPFMSWLLVALFLASLPLEISSESLTLSTYYPAPLGVYAQLITTGVGPSNTLLARDGGNVGVGTASPTALLHAVGRGNGTVAELQGGTNDLALAATANNPGWMATLQNSNGSGDGLTISASNLALFGSASGAGSYGVEGSGGNTGVYGVSANIGVQGSGNNEGVLGYGQNALYGFSWYNNGNGVLGYASGANSNAVQGANLTSSGWSGFFTGGQGLFADRILSSGNAIPVSVGYGMANPIGGPFWISKPSCPAGKQGRLGRAHGAGRWRRLGQLRGVGRALPRRVWRCERLSVWMQLAAGGLLAAGER